MAVHYLLDLGEVMGELVSRVVVVGIESELVLIELELPLEFVHHFAAERSLIL